MEMVFDYFDCGVHVLKIHLITKGFRGHESGEALIEICYLTILSVN